MVTFDMHYCLFVICHDRWGILHLNITKYPTSHWIIQQLREAFPFDPVPRIPIFGRDAKCRLEVPTAIRYLKITRYGHPSKAHGKTGLRSVGSKAARGT